VLLDTTTWRRIIITKRPIIMPMASTKRLRNTLPRRTIIAKLLTRTRRPLTNEYRLHLPAVTSSNGLQLGELVRSGLFVGRAAEVESDALGHARFMRHRHGHNHQVLPIAEIPELHALNPSKSATCSESVSTTLLPTPLTDETCAAVDFRR
jgi:hypothetical protein